MIQEIKKFNFKENELRTFTDESGEVWFVAKDVCDVLDYSNPSKTIFDHLDDDERSNIPLDRGGSLSIINESGLYTLIIRSNKPEAKPFRKWITSQVLPAIRKTGSYSMQDNSVLIMESNYKFTMKRLDEVKEEKKKLVRQVLEATPFWGNIKHYKDLGLSNVETGRAIEKSSRFVGRSLKKMKALGIEPEAVPLPTLYRIAASRLEDQTTLLAAYRTRFPGVDETKLVEAVLPAAN